MAPGQWRQVLPNEKSRIVVGHDAGLLQLRDSAYFTARF